MVHLEYLADHTSMRETIARWYVDEWGYLKEVDSVEGMIATLNGYLNTDKVPLMILAMDGEKAVGVAQLKFHEMEQYPDYEYWLGGVYVVSEYRGKGIARKIIEKIISDARRLGVQKMYLQTERLDGGLYKEMGWQPIEQTNNHGIEVLVMENQLGV